MKQLTQQQAANLNRTYYKTFDTVEPHRFCTITKNTEQELRDHIESLVNEVKNQHFDDEGNRQFWLDYYANLAIVKVSESNFAV